jgi:formyl-CoA transferase
MLQEVQLEDGEPLMVPGIVPKLSLTPGAQTSNAPKLGEHTEQVLREIGLTDSQIGQLRARGVIN